MPIKGFGLETGAEPSPLYETAGAPASAGRHRPQASSKDLAISQMPDAVGRGRGGGAQYAADPQWAESATNDQHKEMAILQSRIDMLELQVRRQSDQQSTMQKDGVKAVARRASLVGEEQTW